MTTTIAPADRAYELIDEALSDMAGVNVVEANKMTDLLLDLRLLLSQIVGSSDD
jgi:hypothetical protein